MQNSNLTERLYKSMLLIREVEELICKVYFTDVIKSPVHLSIGQEAVASGVCEALNKDDLIAHTYRCHATYIAKGGNLKQMMAELYGKKNGCAGGKAGSMHLIDLESGITGASAVVGTTIPVSAGYALALKRENAKNNTSRIMTSFFGDGSTEEGCFSETINFAALHDLPMLFVCENNGFAIHNPLENRWATPYLLERIATYGIKTKAVRSGDVLEIYEATNELLEYIRTTKKPAFIEIDTYRYKEHVGPKDDIHQAYRDQSVYQKWRSHDQIDMLEAKLPSDIVQKIKEQVAQEIEEAKLFAENDLFPTKEDLYANVYA
ncbi:MAG: acetoin dehydrogenase [Alphaproteobacteria bacterium 33-17]|nr:MAG: acetoin dehydrogenase [Alphaproteobacteria bacterium 33-17]